MAAVRHFEFLKVLIFGRMTVITFNICRGTLNFIRRFLPRDAYMHSADYAVCLSVRPSHAGIESKRLYIISSKFFHYRVAPPF